MASITTTTTSAPPIQGQVGMLRRDPLNTGFVALTIALAGVGLGLYGDYNHFTWWYITLFLVHMINVLLAQTLKNGDRDLHDELAFVFLGGTATVITGIVLMSVSECTMINDTKDMVGSAMYIIGNFAIHYAPSVIVVAVWPVPAFDRTRQKMDQAVKEIILGFGLFIAYLALLDAPEAYGCTITRDVMAVAGFGATVVVCAIAASTLS